jgi:hypothetical protein
VPALTAVLVIAPVIASDRPTRRFLPFALVLALTGVAAVATFFTAPVDGTPLGVAATLAEAPAKEDDPATVIDMTINVARCANPVEVTILATFPSRRLNRVLPPLEKQPGIYSARPLSGMTAIVPDAQMAYVDGSEGPQKASGFLANWIKRRGVGSCYLDVPELTGDAAAEAYWRLGVDPKNIVISGSVEVHTPLDASHGPDDDVSEPSVTRRRCGSMVESCAFDLVLTEPWRGTFENLMLLVIGALFSVLAELAMRHARAATT